MKLVPFLTLVVVLHFCTIPQAHIVLNSFTEKTAQRQFDTKTTADSTSITTAKTEATANAVQLNGESNTVTIIQDCEKSDSTESHSISKNTVQINGKNNAVNIRQSGKSGKATIHQNGNSNQVNIIQHKVNNQKNEVK